MLTKRAFLYGCVGCGCALGSGLLLARELRIAKESMDVKALNKP
jgi:hypothetical protein